MSFGTMRRSTLAVAVGSGLAIGTVALVAGPAQGQDPVPRLVVTIQSGKAPVVATPAVRPGPTELVVRQAGKGERTLVLARLQPGTTAEQVRAMTRPRLSERAVDRLGKTVTTFVATGSTGPGRGYRTNVVLTPGTYVALDTTPERNLPQTVLEVAGEPTTAAPPAADATVDMLDYRFTASRRTLPADGTLRVRNRGKQLHFLLAFPTSTSRNASRLVSLLRRGAEREAERLIAGPPTEPVGLVSPGVENRTKVKLRKGNYVFVCFYGSPASRDRGHNRLGMVRKVRFG